MSQYVPTFGGRPDPMCCPARFKHFRRKGHFGWFVGQVDAPHEQRVPGSGPFWRKITAMRVASDMTTASATAHYIALMDERAPRDELGKAAWEIIIDQQHNSQRVPKGFA